jgi:tetratricopeptide (TPR) repeat protein
MNKRPELYDLKASFEWIKREIGSRASHRQALRHLDNCLGVIASYEHSFLMSKASALVCLEEWGALSDLLAYLSKRYPNDAEVLSQLAEMHFAHGNWAKALALTRQAERFLRPVEHRHFLEVMYDMKIACLMALGKKLEAMRTARQVLAGNPRFSIVRAALSWIQKGQYQVPQPWAPKAEARRGAPRKIRKRGRAAIE